MKLRTEYWPKPIALRYFDWQAWDADTYDGCDPAGSIGRCLGHGATEQAAIEDWQQQWAEAHNYVNDSDRWDYERGAEDAQRKRDAAEGFEQ